jgi:hypothetical protein
MKLFSFAKITRNQCLFLGLTVIILAMFCVYKKKTTIIEGNFVDDVTTALENGVNTWSGISDASYDASNNVAQSSSTDTITIKRRARVSAIVGDNCSTQSLLSSEYKNDICDQYQGDYQAIDQKCKLLSNSNCSLSKCCVLLNGTKCVAGNVNGPTYLTDQGNQIDFNYYMYGSKTYPENYNPTPSNGYIENCSMYSSNSANIDKHCIIQLYNDAGCSNTSPDALINNDTVFDHKTIPLYEIKDDIQNAVTLLKGQITTGDDDSRILCDGKDPYNPCDDFNNNDVDLSLECMIKMFNDAGCPNTEPYSFIDDAFVSDNSLITKQNLKTNITAATRIIKISADTDPTGSESQKKNTAICYGAPEAEDGEDTNFLTMD